MGLTVIIGGGLAGSECAWQIARLGGRVRIIEMKPQAFSPAHRSPDLAELVCSNSLRSDEPTMAVGLLKEELRAAGSLIMTVADAARVPAGKALAVDRQGFSAAITAAVEAHPAIELVRAEVRGLPARFDDDPLLAGAERVVVAAGPLASESLAASLAKAVGQEGLYFYDAIAPIVSAASVDMDHAFTASRWNEGEGDYINCPLTEEEYRVFVQELKAAQTVPSRDFEKEVHFEGCLPIEEMAARGDMTLTYGPMKPVGLTDPRTGRRPYAVVQLRAENRQRTMYNMVGFQTKLRHGEQRRIFGLIPALRNAEYERLGSIHRNTYVNAPRVLTPGLELRTRPGVFLAGQIAGVEGYVESTACGLWLGLSIGGADAGRDAPLPPVETMLGALLSHLRTENPDFQPMNANFGLTPPLNQRAGKNKRRELYAQRGRELFGAWLAGLDLPKTSTMPAAGADRGL